MPKHKTSFFRKGPLQRLMCRFGRHHRDRNAVRREDGVWGSICTGCGLALIKKSEEWVVRPERVRGGLPVEDSVA